MTKVEKTEQCVATVGMVGRYLALPYGLLFVGIGCTGRVTERGTCALSVGWVLHGILHNRYIVTDMFVMWRVEMDE